MVITFICIYIPPNCAATNQRARRAQEEKEMLLEEEEERKKDASEAGATKVRRTHRHGDTGGTALCLDYIRHESDWEPLFRVGRGSVDAWSNAGDGRGGFFSAKKMRSTTTFRMFFFARLSILFALSLQVWRSNMHTYVRRSSLCVFVYFEPS